MNYRHIFHAGNFADVIKHTVLIVLLEALQRKETPFCFVDTHAGIGLYALDSAQTQKQREYENGIAKLWQDKTKLPTVIQRYLNIINTYNLSKTLKYYPGSPLIAAQLLRPQDQMILCELHRDDYQLLRKQFIKSSKVAVHHMDGYLAMKAFLPPKEKRGLVLIDPPFESKHEFQQIYEALQLALKHWRMGCFMIWYPIKNKSAVQQFEKKLSQLAAPRLIIHFELNQTQPDDKLTACGIAILNPPWQTEEHIEEKILPYLAECLSANWRARTDSNGRPPGS